MKITVRVKTNARHEEVEEVREGYYHVAVKAKPVGGQANEALVKVLARHFQVPTAEVRIVFGKTSKEKIVEIGK